MKVSGNSDKKQVEITPEVAKDAVRQSNKELAEKIKRAVIDTVTKEDRVDVSSTASAIQSELNPAQFADERRQKVEKLKELVRSGKYFVSSDKIAQAIGDDITLEILTSNYKQGED